MFKYTVLETQLYKRWAKKGDDFLPQYMGYKPRYVIWWFRYIAYQPVIGFYLENSWARRYGKLQ